MAMRLFAPARETRPALAAPRGIVQRQSREQEAGEAPESAAPRREDAPPLPAAARLPGEPERAANEFGRERRGRERRPMTLEPREGPGAPAAQAERGAESTQQEAAAEQPRLVDDSAETLQPGQMRKTDFFAELRGSIEEAAEAALSGTGRTARDCPYITYWLSFYERQPAAMIEPALSRYAPEAGRVESARDYIRLVTERVSRAVAIWASSGRITGVPEGVQAGGAEEMKSGLGAGQPLDSGARARMEGAFGRDFSAVRVHTGASAASVADRFGARAFTIGQDVAFAAGEYRPGSLVGDALLAHELAHVAQQDRGPSEAAAPVAEDALERDANRSAVAVLSRLWSGATQLGATMARNAMPSLRSGLRLSRCRSRETTPPQEQRAEGGGTPAAPTPPPTVAIAEVNAPTTDAPVKRIPPRKDTPVAVTVTGTVAADAPVTLEIEGASANNGTATISGNATHSITATETVQLRGGTQTVPGNAGNLKLVANHNGTKLAESNAFSVAAYPIEIGFNFHALIQGTVSDGNKFWGASYNVTFKSDSGVGGDCDRTKISEIVNVAAATGLWAGGANRHSGFNRTTNPQRDHHATGASSTADMQAQMDAADLRTSRHEAHQFFRFSCERTGVAEDPANAPKVPTSGFKIDKRASKSGGKYFMHVTKQGFANNGVAAGAVNDTSEKTAEVN